MIIALFAATVLMADATAALQAAPTPSTAAAAGSAAAPTVPPKKAEMVCRSEPVLGSRLPVKKCRTAEQAATDKANAREELERAQGANANNPH